jgi:hypothetical protein
MHIQDEYKFKYMYKWGKYGVAILTAIGKGLVQFFVAGRSKEVFSVTGSVALSEHITGTHYDSW